MITFTLPWLS